MPAFRSEKVIAGQPLIEMHHVARRFIKRRDRHRSFQDRFIRLLSRRNVEHEEFWPLRDVSLTLQPGESLGVIGPNGAGKSTLLKLVTGILPPTSGDLFVNGRVCSLLELGAGFQPDLTGRENIFLNGSIYGLTRAEMNARVERIVDFAELGDFIDTPVKHYSSGMYVRLGFAVAINTDPDLLLVDEVLAVGDATFQHKCLSAIQDYRAAGGTLLLVSHDLNAIQSTCTQAAWLEHGLLQAAGKPIDVVMAYLSEMARKEEATRSAREAGETTDPAIVVPGRWGNGDIRIMRLELCDDTGAVRSTFKTGAPLEVRLHYQARHPIERPVFGLAFYHENGAHVSGPNTRFGGLEIPVVEGAGVVSYRVDELPLLEGRYRLSAAVVDSVSDEVYDYQDRLYHFQVYPDSLAERYGLVTLGGVWSIEGAVVEVTGTIAVLPAPDLAHHPELP